MLGGQFGKQKRWVFPVPQWDARKAKHVEDAPTSKISSAAWRKACIRAGLPTLRFHDLGHTWASWHVQNETPRLIVKELGGWASLTLVERNALLGKSHIAA
ncbi:hypothetical protein BH09PSE5_BH09PSE5_36950 [soil metagenome]